MTDPRDEWKAQEPPRGFADGVMDRIAREEPTADRATAIAPASRSRRLRWGVVSSVAIAASIALAIGLHGSTRPSHGAAIAADREQIDLGARAVAVLEPGARVAWNGDDVNQDEGDVFYRVSPGGAFRVHTPAGDVQVMGTCFRVRVVETSESESEVQVNGRDVKAAVIGAGIATAALVTVYEGKVAVARGGSAVTLNAGEAARADASGVHRSNGAGSDGAIAGNGAGGADDVAGDPLIAANANLADSVREYKQRLESIEAQKKKVEKDLEVAQEKLAVATNDGQALPHKSQYDLSTNDWKDMAAQGRVAARFPCINSAGKNEGASAADMKKMGLPESDLPILDKAVKASRDRVWGTIRPLCVNALQGDAAMADKLGPGTCQSLVSDVAAGAGIDVSNDMRTVAEIRAGLKPMPADGGDPVIKMMLALTGESSLVEQDLAKQLGPNDAHELVYGDDAPGCWSNSQWTVGPRPVMP